MASRCLLVLLSLLIAAPSSAAIRLLYPPTVTVYLDAERRIGYGSCDITPVDISVDAPPAAVSAACVQVTPWRGTAPELHPEDPVMAAFIKAAEGAGARLSRCRMTWLDRTPEGPHWLVLVCPPVFSGGFEDARLE